MFEEATLPEGLAARGYGSVCIGGTGFFNGRNALGSVPPSLFDEAHWAPSLGVSCRSSPINQVGRAIERLQSHAEQRVFLFIASALHQRLNASHRRQSPGRRRAEPR